METVLPMASSPLGTGAISPSKWGSLLSQNLGCWHTLQLAQCPFSLP